MSFFAIIELIFKALGLWEGLNDYVTNKQIDQMRTDILTLRDEEDKIKGAKTDDQIYASQSTITKSN